MITILFLAANPADTVRLLLDEESRQIDLALRAAQFRAQFALEKHYAVRAADLPSLLLRYQPDIVHFSGHGTDDGALLFADEQGRAQPAPPAALARLFGLLADRLRCVVLNACYSAAQAEAIAQSIDCVIGLSDAMGDQAALRFSVAFYQALAYGRDLATAFELGCLQVALAGDDDAAIPQLITRDPRLAQVVLASAAAPAPASAGANRPTFATTVQGGAVGQVINVERLEGGLTLHG